MLFSTKNNNGIVTKLILIIAIFNDQQNHMTYSNNDQKANHKVYAHKSEDKAETQHEIFLLEDKNVNDIEMLKSLIPNTKEMIEKPLSTMNNNLPYEKLTHSIVTSENNIMTFLTQLKQGLNETLSNNKDVKIRAAFVFIGASLMIILCCFGLKFALEMAKNSKIGMHKLDKIIKEKEQLEIEHGQNLDQLPF